jgi:hypothetical protein
VIFGKTPKPAPPQNALSQSRVNGAWDSKVETIMTKLFFILVATG